MMNAIRSLARCQQMCKFTTSAVRPRDMAKFKELQRQMQVDDGVPVFLKKGASDRAIFGFVCIYLAGLLLWSGHTVKRIIFPAPNK